MNALFRLGIENAAVATLLALVVAVLSRVFHRRAALVHLLWVVVLLKLVAPPLFSVPLPTRWIESTDEVQAHPDAPATERPYEPVVVEQSWIEDDSWVAEAESATPRNDGLGLSTGASKTPPQPPDIAPVETISVRVTRLLGGLWLIGTLAAAIVAVTRILRFRRVLRLLKPPSEAVDELVRETAADLGLKRLPVIGMAPGTVAPMVWGLGRASTLLIPIDLWKNLDERGRITLVAHELAHLKRGDHWVRLLETLVTVFYWWLPTVWWVRSALREVEERCCDAWVVWAYPEDARAYAETLLETVDFLSPVRTPMPALASGFGRVHSLKGRLTMILRGTTKRTLGLGGGLFALALSAALLPLNPTFAQSEDKASDKPSETPPPVVPVPPSAGPFLYELAPDAKVVTTFQPVGAALVQIMDGAKKTIGKWDTVTFTDSPDAAKTGRYVVRVGPEGKPVPASGDEPKAEIAIGSDDADGAKTEVYTGETKEIIAKLYARIAELKKKGNEQAKVDALCRIVESLESIAKAQTAAEPLTRVRTTHSMTPKQAAQAQILQAEYKVLKKMADQQQAQLHKTAQALEETQLRLKETQQKLSILGVLDAVNNYPVAAPSPTVPPDTLAPPVVATDMNRDGVRYTVVHPVYQDQERRTVSRPVPNDQERRLAEVEKKLQLILDRLDANNKDDAKRK